MIKKIWDRVMNREVISYLICGVLTTLVNWIVYAALVKLSVDYLIATARGLGDIRSVCFWRK